MKKVLLSLVTVMFLLAVAGCGEKTTMLECKQTTSGIDVSFNVGFKGNVIDTIDFGYDMNLEAYSDTQINTLKGQDFCEIVKSSMETYKDAFMSCKQEVVNKHLYVKSELDIDKIADNTLAKTTTPEKAKEGLEGKGYTCTIK